MKQHPNIILMLVDDLGYGDLSCFNPESKIRTEHLDALAAQGLACTDMHAAAAVCSPSRYALMTGRYNWRSNTKFGVLPGTSPPLIEEGRTTLASLLKEQGYRTACVGKWHLGMTWSTRPGVEQTYDLFTRISPDWDMGIDFTQPAYGGPLDRGFDYFFGLPASLSQAPVLFMENRTVIDQPDHEDGVDDCDTKTPNGMYQYERGPLAPGFDFKDAVPRCDAKVLELVEEYAKDDQPFFLYYPTLAVHSPLVPADEFRGRSGIGDYGDFVLQVDDFVGRLTAKLEETGIADDTILIFTSDNGCAGVVDFPKLETLGHRPSYHFRGAKTDIWEGGHRVPFLVRWPGHVAPGTRCAQTLCLTDLLATFAELTGASYGDDTGEDSVSNLPLWLGEDRPVRTYTVSHSVVGKYAIRKGPWKLEMCPGSGGLSLPDQAAQAQGLPPIQLYDLSVDVGEQDNVCNQYPGVVAELTQLLTQCIQQGRSTPGAPQRNNPSDVWPGLDWMPDEDRPS